MSITATRIRGTRLPADRYQCDRCGHVARYNRKRGRPDLCRDCKGIKTTTTTKEPTT